MITIRHQLTMTTGLDDGAGDPYCTDKSCLVYKADPGRVGPITTRRTRCWIRWCVRRAVFTLNQFFQTRIAVKTGMSGLFFKSGYNNVFASTGRSMAWFGLLVLNRGHGTARRFLSDTAYFRAMTSNVTVG